MSSRNHNSMLRLFLVAQIYGDDYFTLFNILTLPVSPSFCTLTQFRQYYGQQFFQWYEVPDH